jgi:hypothetical protein
MTRLVALLLAYCLVAAPCFAAFPTTAVLDDFNRANENPLSLTGAWGAPIHTGTLQTMKLSSNAIMDDSLADGGGSGQAYRDDQNYGPGVEAYVTLLNPWANNSSDFWFWMNGNAENAAGRDGYKLYAIYNTGVWYYNVYRTDNDVETELTPSFEAGPTLASGDKLGGEIAVGGTITWYYKASAGSWGAASGVSTRSDATYTSGHIGLSKGFNDTTTSLDDFGGGTIVASSSVKRFTLLGVGP